MLLLHGMIGNRETLTNTDAEYCKEMKMGMEQGLSELEQRYADTEVVDNSSTIEDILKLFDDNGNRILNDESDNIDWDEFIKELEEKYSNVELPDNCPTVEEILAAYNDNGNALKGGGHEEMDEHNSNNEAGNEYQKTRRRRRKRKNKTVKIDILHSNTCGYSSKQEVWTNILKKEQPEIVTVNETLLKGKRKIKQKDYFSYCKNRERNMGGIATLVANSLKENTTKVGEGSEGDEYNIVRLDHIKPPLNIINWYGEQESRNSNDDIPIVGTGLEKT
jgi:hypothetical protein